MPVSSVLECELRGVCIVAADCAGTCGGSAVTDCNNVCNGTATYDVCGVCGGGGIPSGACNCAGDTLDCAGVCGGGASYDSCGVCNGGNSCVDCAGTPYVQRPNSAVCAMGATVAWTCGDTLARHPMMFVASAEGRVFPRAPAIAPGTQRIARARVEAGKPNACGVWGDNSSCTGCMDATTAVMMRQRLSVTRVHARILPTLLDCQGTARWPRIVQVFVEVEFHDDCGVCGGDGTSCVINCTWPGSRAEICRTA